MHLDVHVHVDHDNKYTSAYYEQLHLYL